MAKTATRRLNIFLNGKAVAGTIKDMRKEWRKLNNEIADLQPGTKQYINTAKRMKELDGLMKEHRSNIRNIGTAQNKISIGLKNIVGLTGLAFTAQVVVDYGKELFRLGSEMEVLEKKAKTVFGEALPLVTEQAEKNAASMGLTVSQYVDANAAIGDLLIPMGFQREEAANISTNLVNLSGALSEWTGGQVSATEVTDILGKAMLGEREQLKGLGISISEADVKARLAEKGLSNLTGEMLQQAKAAATLELITEKSGDSQAAFAANSDTLVRKQAELSAKFETIKEQMASALIPVFHRLFEAAEPIVSTFADIISAIFKGDQAVDELQGGMKVLGIIIGNAGKLVRFTYEAFTALGGFLLDNFGGTIEFVGGLFIRLQNGIVSIINSIAETTGLETRLRPINIEDFKSSIQDAKKALNESKIQEPVTVPVLAKPGGSNTDKDAALKAAAEANKLAQQREKAAEKQEKDLEKRLQRLQQIRDKYAEEARLSALSEEDRKLQELAAKYDAQIEEAKALEAKGVKEATAQRLALERTKAMALADLQQELFEKQQEAASLRESEEIARELESLQAKETAKREAQAEIDATINEFILEEREQELLDLENHFFELTQLAAEHGLDTLSLEIAYRQKKAAINAEFDKKEKEERIKQQAAQVKILQESYKKAAEVIGAALDGLTALGVKNTALSKLLAVAQIGIDTASAISSGVAAGAKAGPFPANLAAIATTVATVLTNIGLAKKTLDSVAVPQKKKGGYFKVKGMDDGISYNAKYIGSPQSGMLPSAPVLLASEAGQEYFVSNKDLQNPVIANYTRIIDNISKGRVRQFVDGGFTNKEEVSQAPTDASNLLLVQTLNRLSTILEQGIYAIYDDDAIIAFQERFNELQSVARGSLG